MSASVFSPTSRSSWRSHNLDQSVQAFDPSQSYPYTRSAGGFSALEASTFSMPTQVSIIKAHHPPQHEPQRVTREYFVFFQNGALTQQQLERGLSELGTTGDGTGVVFLTLTLKVSPETYNITSQKQKYVTHHKMDVEGIKPGDFLIFKSAS